MNLALSLLGAAERTPEREALVAEDRRLTYSDLRARAARIATGLADRGVRRGDRVACVLSNEPETAELYWGCLLYTSPSPRDGLLSRMPSSA